MGLEERQTAKWGAVWLVNFASATALILFNSLMMSRYLLFAPVTVSGIQLLVTAAFIALLEALGAWGEQENKSLPAKHLVAFVLISKYYPNMQKLACLHECTHAGARTRSHSLFLAYKHTHARTHRRAHTHTHTHTHMRTHAY